MYDELVKRLRAAKAVVFKADDVDLLAQAADAIEELSASNVRPMVRGKWKETLFGWECTVCGEEQQYAKWLKYCPTCGADMREE